MSRHDEPSDDDDSGDAARGLKALVKRALPWLSLLTGIVGAVLMNRSPGRAWIVVVAAVLGWAVLAVAYVVERRGALAGDRLHQRGARFAIALSNQVAVQQALLFPLPFYLRAAHLVPGPLFGWPEPGHVVFFLLYSGALGVALWDPMFARAMKRTIFAFSLQAFSVFVGLDMVLPVLGLSNRSALLVAGLGTAVGVPVALLLAAPSTQSPLRARVVAVAGAVVVVVLARLAAPFVPPAPLELVSIGIGTGIEDKELTGAADVIESPTVLYCHSAIKAPLGLKDALVHQWWRDGKRFDAVELDVRGGRDAGFRTWSRETRIGAGEWRCVVQTASGQVLGSAHATIR